MYLSVQYINLGCSSGLGLLLLQTSSVQKLTLSWQNGATWERYSSSVPDMSAKKSFISIWTSQQSPNSTLSNQSKFVLHTKIQDCCFYSNLTSRIYGHKHSNYFHLMDHLSSSGPQKMLVAVSLALLQMGRNTYWLKLSSGSETTKSKVTWALAAITDVLSGSNAC